MTRVAIFTDDELATDAGVPATWSAVLRHAPESVAPRIYTPADLRTDERPCRSRRPIGAGLAWYRGMRACWRPPAELGQEMQETGVDVIHITTPGPVGLAGRFIARRLGLPLTGSYHSHLDPSVRTSSRSRTLGRVTDALIHWLYEPCRTLLVPSHATLDTLILSGYHAGQLQVWPPGVDTAKFSPDRRSHWLRWLWGIGDRRPAIAYVGRLSPDHGVHLLPLIQRELASWSLSHRLIIVGDGPMGGELRERCPDAAFLGDRAPEEVAVALASADLLVVPGATDSLGTVVLEAQACGLPAVVSDCGGPQELIVAGRTGLVARTGVAVEFADAIRRILRDRQTQRAMSQRARAFALTRSWDRAIGPLVLAWHRSARQYAAAQLAARGQASGNFVTNG